MSTPSTDGVLSALVLDTKLNLHFWRAGGGEGMRVALVNIGALIELGARVSNPPGGRGVRPV